MDELDFEGLVTRHHAALYRFALSLTREDGEAVELVQQTFYLWATKGHQLRDVSKVKTWLFTTLHREFLGTRRRLVRFPHYEVGEVESELPPLTPPAGDGLDGDTALAALGRLDEVFRAPVALFYLEDCSYNEIGQILEIPLGTVKSRISRGLAQLQRQLADVWHGGQIPAKDKNG